MLGKILLTIVVILLAFVVLRQRHQAERRPRGKGAAPTPAQSAATREQENFARDMRFAAYAFLVLMVGLGGILYYFRWQDNHAILTVTLYRDGEQQPVIYRVYRYQMGERSFTTVDGTSVTVAASERMEVEGLEE